MSDPDRQRPPRDRVLDADEMRAWAAVAHNVTLAPGRLAPKPELDASPVAADAIRSFAATSTAPKPALRRSAPREIEPNRLRRVARGVDALDVRIDLHGLTQEGARGVLLEALRRTHEAGGRWVLVITGKGIGGDGVLRRRLPEWLAEPAFRVIVSGWSLAGRRHGGDGAVYLALRRASHDHPAPLTR